MNQKLFGAMKLIELAYGGYRMQAVPELGGQVISLEKNGVEAFNVPTDPELFVAKSTSYGLPILFPPNRIDGGRFVTPTREYQFAINEPARGNSLHGFLHKRPWKLVKAEKGTLQMEYAADAETDFYQYYPHIFRAALNYQLSEAGLYQEVCIENQGDEPMPIGLGFHSAFKVDEQSLIRVSVGRRILMGERMLPTGELRELNEEEARLRAEGLTPVAWSMDDHYTAEPMEVDGKPFHGAIVERADGRIFYEVDPFYQHWMIWNSNQVGNLICLEPQNWRVNAPNLVSEGMSGQEAGFCQLQPGKALKVYTRLWIESIAWTPEKD